MVKKTPKFHQCKQCSCQTLENICQFATVKRIINGDEHMFCCETSVECYEKEKTESSCRNK